MVTKTATVEMSLDALLEALAKSADDLRATRDVIARAREDIAAHNTSVSRRVVAAAERVVEHLEKTDVALKDVVRGLEERD